MIKAVLIFSIVTVVFAIYSISSFKIERQEIKYTMVKYVPCALGQRKASVDVYEIVRSWNGHHKFVSYREKINFNIGACGAEIE